MKKKIICYFLIILIFVSPTVMARGYHIGKISSHRSYSSTHTVRPYVTKRGSYHKAHLSGNPRSGVHCHNNVCK
jgi:hypothetical protein